MSSDIVEQVKDRVAIEDVVSEFFELGRKSGSKMRARQHDSLVVDTAKQHYYWNSRNEDGDVVAFVMRHKNVDFKEAVEWLAERVNLPVKWGGRDGAQAMANRQREDVFAAGCQVWANYLWQNPAALAYARGRGFDDETIRTIGLGYTGGPGLLKDMRGELTMRNIDPECPAAVCLVGFNGDVKGWAAKYTVDLTDHPDWIEQRYIPGAMGRERLVYPHVYGGRTRYFSTRSILGGVQFDGEGEDRKEVRKSWNPAKTLGGPRQPFYNQAYDRMASAVVVVEGPADAVTLGIWGYAAVALCGVNIKDADGMGVLKERLKKHQVKYIALDNDQAGGESLREVAAAFGPLARLVRWPAEAGGGGISDEASPESGFAPRIFSPISGKNALADDELLDDALALAEQSGEGLMGISIALLCRKLEIGRTRAGRLYEAVKDVLAARAAATGETETSGEAADELLDDALALAEEGGEGMEISITKIQRKLRIGYTRAARLQEQVKDILAARAGMSTSPAAAAVDPSDGQSNEAHDEH